MRTYRTLQAALLVSLIGLMLVGCEDSSVSPCLDCGVDSRYTEVVEQQFFVGDMATVNVSNFVGKVTWRSGDAGVVHVKATKRAMFQSALGRIDVAMTAGQNAIDVRTENPDNLRNAAVDLEITAPANARPQLHNGVGNIDYRGRPRGSCRFTVAAGSVTLGLEADAAVTLDLTVGAGTISVGFPVEGTVQARRVHGRIGSGDEGDVFASTGAGNIYLVRE